MFFVILNYNNYEDTAQCIKSVMKNRKYNIVVVDNNSPDKSGERIKKEFSQCNCILLNNNNGYAAGNNVGIKYALNNGAKYVCVLNNDVVLTADFVDKALKVMNERLDIDIVAPIICEYNKPDYIQSAGAMINLMNGRGRLLHNGELADNINVILDNPDYLGGACFIARREVFTTIGFLPEFYFLYYEETDWFFTAKDKGIRFACDTRLRVYHKGSASVNKVKGLSRYYMTRNQVVFERRKANIIQFLLFILYSLCGGIYHLLIHKEWGYSLKAFFDGLLFKL